MTVKKFEKREISANEENTQIIKLWDNLRKEKLGDDTQREKELNDGPLNMVLDKVEETIKITISDGGKKIILEAFEAHLDSDAAALHKKFMADLIKLILDLGYNSGIDSDIVHNANLLTKPIALIKEILERSLVEAIAKNGGIDNKAQKYFEVFTQFIEKLKQLPLAKESIILSIEPIYRPSLMMIELCHLLTYWNPRIDTMINLVNTLNQTNNIIETNLIALNTMKLHVQNNLYYWHLLAIGNDSSICETNLLETWCSSLLQKMENDLLSTDIHGVLTSNEKAITQKDHIERVQTIAKNIQKKGKVISSCAARIIGGKPTNKDKVNVIALLETLVINNEGKYILGFCNASGEYAEEPIDIADFLISPDKFQQKILMDKKVLEKIDLKIKQFKGIVPTRIPILYNALFELDTIIADIGKIKAIISSVGSLPFLLGVIEAKNLSKWVSDCLNIARDACSDEITKKTLLATANMPIAITHFSDLSLLGEDAFKRKTLHNISEQFKNLKTSAMLEREIINWDILNNWAPKKDSGYRIMSSSQTLSNQGRLANMTMVESDKLSFMLNDKPETFFKVLGITPTAFVNTIQEQGLSDAYLSQELMLDIKKLKILPLALVVLLEEDEKLYFDRAQSLRSKSSKILRKEAANLTQPLALSDNPLQCHQEFINNPFSLSHEALKAYENYKEADNLLINMLEKASKRIDFINRYSSIVYTESIIYIPKKSAVIRRVIELMGIPVHIWEKNAAGELVLIEQFEPAEASKASPKHILYTDMQGFSSFQELQVKCSKTPANPKVAQFLYNLIQEADTRVLNQSQKIEILKYFCVSNMQIAGSSVNKTGEKSLSALTSSENMDTGLHARFSKDGITTILNCLEEYALNPDENLTKAHYEKLKAQIDNALAAYFSKGIYQSYDSRKKLLKFPSEDLHLVWEDHSYTIQKNQYHDRFDMFKAGLFYDCSNKNPLVFHKVTIPGDGHCGFNALGITRADFETCLKNAIKDEANRKILSVEIWNSIKIHDPLAPKPKFYTDDMERNFKHYSEFDNKLLAARNRIDDKIGKNTALVSNENYFEYLKKIANPALKQELQLFEEYFALENKLLDCCASEETCARYIEIYNTNNNQWLGKYSAHIFAKENNFNLRIYFKNTQDINQDFKLVLDKDSSYINDKNKETKYIIFMNAMHFDRLDLDEKETRLFSETWNHYIQYLATNMAILLPKFDQEEQKDITLATIKSHLEQARELKGQQSAQLQHLQQQIEQEKIIHSEIKARKEKADEFDRDTRDYITENLDDNIADLGWLVNTPLNEKKETLLLLAVKQKNAAIITTLLNLGASVATISESDCIVEIGRVDEPKNNSYVLYKIERNVWGLDYYDYKGEITRFTRETHIHNLSQAIKDYEINSTELTRNALIQTVKKHHQMVNPTTPLVSAAMDYGYNKDNGVIFCSLMNAGLEEANNRTEDVENYSILKKLSINLLTQQLIKHYKDYIGEQEASIMDESISAEIYHRLVDFIGKDKTEARSVQHAKLIISLISGEISHDYKKIIGEGKIIGKSIGEYETSRLFGKTRQIMANADNYIEQNITAYANQFKEYTESRVENISSQQIKKLENQIMQVKVEAKLKADNYEKELKETKQEVHDFRKKLEELEKKAIEAAEEKERRREEEEKAKQEKERKREEKEKAKQEKAKQKKAKKEKKKQKKKQKKEKEERNKQAHEGQGQEKPEQEKQETIKSRERFFKPMEEEPRKGEQAEPKETNIKGPLG